MREGAPLLSCSMLSRMVTHSAPRSSPVRNGSRNFDDKEEEVEEEEEEEEEEGEEHEEEGERQDEDDDASGASAEWTRSSAALLHLRTPYKRR